MPRLAFILFLAFLLASCNRESANTSPFVAPSTSNPSPQVDSPVPSEPIVESQLSLPEGVSLIRISGNCDVPNIVASDNLLSAATLITPQTPLSDAVDQMKASPSLEPVPGFDSIMDAVWEKTLEAVTFKVIIRFDHEKSTGSKILEIKQEEGETCTFKIKSKI